MKLSQLCTSYVNRCLAVIENYSTSELYINQVFSLLFSLL